MRHPKADDTKREVFQQRVREWQRQKRPLVYLDESGFAHDMPRTHGYSPVNQRCFGTQDWQAKGRTNAIGALWAGLLITVSLFQGNINSEVFHQWVRQDLLKHLPEQSVVIMDNATFHKRQDTLDLLEKAEHTVEFLPPYSPDLNPIEKKWAQAKACRRKHRCEIDEIFTQHLRSF